MRESFRKGFSFGLTSGIITTLGLMVGLSSGTNSAVVVIGGILVIAVADALSDALGIHISEEYENSHSHKEVWESTIVTFLSKFIFASTFIVPVLLLPLTHAVGVSIIWGLSLIVLFSCHMARMQGVCSYRVVVEHLVIAVLVVVVTHFLGVWVSGLG